MWVALTCMSKLATSGAETCSYHVHMCLIALHLCATPRPQLALIANRDELHARPAVPLAQDPEHADVYGGRDLLAGGGWLMLSTRGRLAAVTNVRDGLRQPAAARSRGELVRGFVVGDAGAGQAATVLASHAQDYGPFNLLLWDGASLAYVGNHPLALQTRLSSGLHVMSNGALDAPWPKTMHAGSALQEWLDSALVEQAWHDNPAALEPLYAALADRRVAADAQLPDTHVGLELERRLSPAFIRDSRYGTRCSSIVLMDGARILFAERSFNAAGERSGDVRLQLARGAMPSLFPYPSA